MTYKTDQYNVPFETALDIVGNGLYNISLMTVCSLMLLGIGVDLFGFTLVVAEACDLDLNITEKGVLSSVPFIGIFVASYFWGSVADVKGRKFTLTISMSVSFVMSALSSLSPNWIVLAVLKFVSVCFSCAANSTAYTLVGESCPQHLRSKYMLIMTTFLLVSPAVSACVTYPIIRLSLAYPIPWLGISFTPWRLLCFVQSIPFGVSAIGIYFFYESPKFLASRGNMDDVLHVLKKIYTVNRHKDDFPIKSLTISELTTAPASLSLKSLWEQSIPLFKAPYRNRTLQLFYIVGVVYSTNNSFFVWLPQIMGLVMESIKAGKTQGNICDLISSTTPNSQTPSPNTCLGNSDLTIYTLIISHALLAIISITISFLSNRKRLLLISILLTSALSSILMNLISEIMTSVVFFVLMIYISLGLGITAAYFVECFPTSCRGTVTCLSLMVGRTFTFAGINLVGNVLFDHCAITFYVWAVFTFSSVVAAWFLHQDIIKKVEQEITKL